MLEGGPGHEPSGPGKDHITDPWRYQPVCCPRALQASKDRASSETCWKLRAFGNGGGKGGCCLSRQPQRSSGEAEEGTREEPLCPAGGTLLPGWWKAMRMPLPVALVPKMAPDISSGFAVFTMPDSVRVGTVTEVTFRF